jgi:GNAT superfamily N-acetyltransferase
MKNVSTFYEINRLSVEASERGRGIGQLLLRSIEEFVKAKEQDHSDTKIGLFASTPEVLKAANKLYASNGFDLMEDVMMGKMNIKTFVKLV